MTRKSRREIERALDDLAPDPDERIALDEVRVVHETADGWVDSMTGEPVDVDDFELVADFSGGRTQQLHDDGDDDRGRRGGGR